VTRASTESSGLRDERRREKDRVSREHILDAAEQVFGEKGFHTATLKEVAERAEFSVGALYAFFEGKDDLFVQVLERQGRALLDDLQEAIDGIDSAVERLHRIADAQVQYFRERPDFYRLFQRELGGTTWGLRASLNERGYERYLEVMDFETEVFSSGVETGELRPDDPSAMAALFSGIMQAYIGRWVLGLRSNGTSEIDETYPSTSLHELIDRAFVAGGQA
jgi:AcrR family transcriptional regulator